MPLSDTNCRTAKPRTKPYKMGDSGGLYLQITPQGSKLWNVKYRYGGKEKKLALGKYPEVSLAAAREGRDQARKMLAEGKDPSLVKQEEKRIRVATKYDNLKRTAPKAPGIRWVDVKGSVRRPGSGGAVNETEAQAVMSALEDLVLRQGYKGSIGVVSPFRAQANAITAAVSRNDRLDKELQKHGFLSDTVHKFQGDERDIMIFSPVVSKGMPIGGLGFLRGNGNLFNVAITRARAQLVVVGDLSECSKCGVDYLSNFAIYTQKLAQEEQKVLGEQYGEDLGRGYPIVSNPEQVSDWEKILYSALYDAGIRTLPQYRIEKYALDLALLEGKAVMWLIPATERRHASLL